MDKPAAIRAGIPSERSISTSALAYQLQNPTP